MLIALVVFGTAPLWWSSYKEWVAPERFMFIDMTVEDAVTGEDHQLFVNREITTEFAGEWIVEVVNAADGTMVSDCVGRGENIYKPSNNIRQPVALFAWWMERSICVLPPGEYYIQTQWTMTITGYPVKVLHRISNVFKVLPR